jgi:benzoate-CoA ligase
MYLAVCQQLGAPFQSSREPSMTALSLSPANASAPPDRFNAAAYLLSLNANRSGKLAYIDDHQRLTYRELDDRVRRCATGLLAAGLKRGDRMLMVMHDSVDFPVAFLGALWAGVLPVPVNTLLPAADYAYMLTHCEAKAVLVSAPLLDTLQAAVATSGLSLRVLVSGGTAEAASFASLLASEPMSSPADSAANDDAFWLYSSGSTGRPKGVVHSHANLYWTAALYAQPVLGLREEDVLFSAAKLFFAYGLGNALTFPLSVGATTVLMAERPTPAAVFKRWTTQAVTVFFGAPTGFAGMLASPDLPARDAVKLRMCSSAGEALPRDIGERFTRHFGCDIIDGIGSTEMLHIYLSNRPGDVNYGTTGRAVPGYRLKLVDEDGATPAVGDIGELYISGPTAARMYWNDPEKSAATFQGEWTKSGDKYRIDAQGCYVYAGRSDDMLKVSGIYVSPFEVEATLMQHSAVLEAAVVGQADADGLTRTLAYVVLKAGQAASADELKAFVKDRLAPHKYPRHIEFLDELPKTATGKIQRFRLRDGLRALG